MRPLLLLALLLSLASCASYQPPAGATARIKFVGNQQYAYIDYGNSCSTRAMVARDIWSSSPIKDGARVWVEQGIDTTGLAYGMKCEFHYSFEPQRDSTYVSEYSSDARSCKIAVYRLSASGERVPEASVRREPGRLCFL